MLARRLLWRALRQWEPDLVVLSLKQANVVGRSRRAPSRRADARPSNTSRGTGHAGPNGRPARCCGRSRFGSTRSGPTAARRTARHGALLPAARRRRHHVIPLFHTEETLAAQDGTTSSMRPCAWSPPGGSSSRKNMRVAVEAVRGAACAWPSRCLWMSSVTGRTGSRSGTRRRVGPRRPVQLAGYQRTGRRTRSTTTSSSISATPEGFCIGVAEAMAAGLPVIATAVGGIREYGSGRGEHRSSCTRPTPDAWWRRQAEHRRRQTPATDSARPRART